MDSSRLLDWFSLATTDARPTTLLECLDEDGAVDSHKYLQYQERDSEEDRLLSQLAVPGKGAACFGKEEETKEEAESQVPEAILL